MTNLRVENLVKKLTRGISKSLEIFHSADPDLWDKPIYDDPEVWNLKDLAIHFIYSEEHLLSIAQDIASGGEGSPEGIDIDAFNNIEMEKQRHRSVDELLDILSDVRKASINWVRELDEHELNRMGRHPVLGTSSVETVINSIYAHQLLHMREIAPRIKK
ncbi:MAG: hypothetical protein GTO14_12630 [Anaerolineales bacterium]|nr:hypothetical protein [Anaerolineales bacterium]